MTNAEYVKAIDLRRSRRSYRSQKLSEEIRNLLKEMVETVNESANLHFIFVDDGTPYFNVFSGQFSMIIVCGPDTQKAREDSGYYGESIVLQCAYNGLGTCWVSGTYSENKVYESFKIPREERIYCVITIGHVKDSLSPKEKIFYNATHKTNKPYQKMFEFCETKLPDEYAYAMQLVEKAPSAVNRRPVKFRYENEIISGAVDEPYSDMSVDFGIAKLHFVIGCKAKGIEGAWNDENQFIKKEKAEIIKVNRQVDENEGDEND